MTPFAVDTRAVGTSVSRMVTENAAGTVQFSPTLRQHYRVGNGWATWSHGYTGSVYFSGEASGGSDPRIELSLPSNTNAYAFRVYAEPNTFGNFSVEATASDGTSSEPVRIEGRSGARYFGSPAPPGAKLTSITVTASDPRGFAIGEFSINR